ncbi:hypothetical protein V6N13_026576 [Hibiscus sabdariffa]
MGQSVTNRLNRSKLEEPHCSGTRSFPRIVEDLTKESDGIPPTRADVYVKSRTHKDGSVVNSKAAIVVERIQEKINESSSSDNLSQTSWSNDVFAQVKGPERRGHVHLHVPDMDALLRMVNTEATPDGGSASAAVNSTSRSLPSTNQQNTGGNGPSTQ